MDELSAAGRQLRCIVTNLAVFGGGRRAALALVRFSIVTGGLAMIRANWQPTAYRTCRYS